MYDPFAKGLIENLPDFRDLVPDEAQRVLSRTYFSLINLRLSRRRELTTVEVEDVLYLRRLANTLESRAIFDSDVSLREQQASAFVAAEGLSLLAAIREALEEPSSLPIRIEREEIFSRIEAALLYIIAGYDANAGGTVRAINPSAGEPTGSPFRRTQFLASEWALDILVLFCRLHLNPLPPTLCPIAFVRETPPSLADLTCDVRGRLFARLGESVAEYMGWLAGEIPEGLSSARDKLVRVADRLAGGGVRAHPDVHHLARLLLAVMNSTESRSLCHNLPIPPTGGDEYREYLYIRSKGPEGESGRPLLWPSVHRYAEECLPGPSRHAVISMPTGSGKSFLAELAASQALLTGWVLYLVPTNALANQVRRDLKNNLAELKAEILAFIGHEEYTALEADRVERVPPRAVIVMTPEKCSLAMRLNPDVFRACSLCIFDECHLIAEKSRGVNAELVLSQLMLLAPNCCFLLMSAMVQNPGRLANWLSEATGRQGEPVQLSWRPTRSLRCVVGLDSQKANEEYNAAKQRLERKPDWVKEEEFEPSFALLAGLQGAWQTNNQLDYCLAKIPAAGLLSIRRSWASDAWTFKPQAASWVNETSGRLGTMLASANIPTLIFLPANKHHSFSVAEKVNIPDDVRLQLPQPSDRVRAFGVLAEDELGLPSMAIELIRRGLTVHTAGLLEAEKLASEEAFREQCAIVMLATGTLAQGLNLPSIAVVIGGTKIGFPPKEPRAITEQRKLAQLLNASGRAGRAGFANQGLVITVPDKPKIFGGTERDLDIRQSVAFLNHPDAAIEVLSPLTSFVDSISVGRFEPGLASPEELVAASMLTGGGPGSPPAAEVLKRTYAAYLKREAHLDDGAEKGAERLGRLREDFVAKSGAPDWLSVAAHRAGLDFFSMLRFFRAWKRAVPVLSPIVFEWNTRGWLAAFSRTLEYTTPRYVLETFRFDLTDLPSEMQRRVNILANRRDNPQWTPHRLWLASWRKLEAALALWMDGGSIKQLAGSLLDLDPNQVSAKRNAGTHPVPKTLAFVGTIVDRLSIVAGGMVSLIEEELRVRRAAGEQWPVHLPYELMTFPLALRYGCDTPQTLAWYRFGLRFRRPAHLLNQAFPLDPTVQDEYQLATTVRALRNKWLHGQIQVPAELIERNGSVFDAIKIILRAQSDGA